MNEIARFQRLSSVSSAGSVRQDVDDLPDSSAARPVSPSSARGRREPIGDRGEQSRRVDAVVVGERDEVRRQVLEGGVPGAREPPRRAEAHHLDRAVLQRLRRTPVLVLVDDEHAYVRVLLRLDRVEQPSELVAAAHRRDDQVERREPLRHAP